MKKRGRGGNSKAKRWEYLTEGEKNLKNVVNCSLMTGRFSREDANIGWGENGTQEGGGAGNKH